MVYVGFLGQICLYKSPTMYLLHQIIFGTVYIQVSMTHVNHSALLHGYLHLKAFNELASFYFYNAWPSNPQLSSSLHACKKLHTTLCIRIIANFKNLNRKQYLYRKHGKQSSFLFEGQDPALGIFGLNVRYCVLLCWCTFSLYSFFVGGRGVVLCRFVFQVLRQI